MTPRFYQVQGLARTRRRLAPLGNLRVRCNFLPSRMFSVNNRSYPWRWGAIQKSYIEQNVIISAQQSPNRRTANRADTQVCPYPTHLLIHDMPVGADLCVPPSVWACLHHFFVLHHLDTPSVATEPEHGRNLHSKACHHWNPSALSADRSPEYAGRIRLQLI